MLKLIDKKEHVFTILKQMLKLIDKKEHVFTILYSKYLLIWSNV